MRTGREVTFRCQPNTGALMAAFPQFNTAYHAFHCCSERAAAAAGSFKLGIKRAACGGLLYKRKEVWFPTAESENPNSSSTHQGVVVLDLLHGGLSGKGVLDHGVGVQPLPGGHRGAQVLGLAGVLQGLRAVEGNSVARLQLLLSGRLARRLGGRLSLRLRVLLPCESEGENSERQAVNKG